MCTRRVVYRCCLHTSPPITTQPDHGKNHHSRARPIKCLYIEVSVFIYGCILYEVYSLGVSVCLHVRRPMYRCMYVYVSMYVLNVCVGLVLAIQTTRCLVFGSSKPPENRKPITKTKLNQTTACSDKPHPETNMPRLNHP